MDSSVRSDPLTGKCLAERYEILQRLGEGGVGVVYRARDIKVDRQVAIKILDENAAKEKSWEQRFRNAAKAAAQLSHPNSVRIQDYGETPEGLLYVVMELLKGRTLSTELLRTGKFAPARALAILRDMGESLTEAHAYGIIHRNLTPDNVFLLEGAGDRLKILDYNLAKVDTPSGQAATAAGMVIGSPAYISPEQARGEPLTACVDIYACGVIGYEMLMGHPPFQSKRSVELVALHLMKPPPPLVGVPEAIAALILRMLEKDPGQRPPSVKALLAELQALAGKNGSKEPAEAKPEPKPADPDPLPLPQPDPGKTLVSDGARVASGPPPLTYRPGMELNPPHPAIAGAQSSGNATLINTEPEPQPVPPPPSALQPGQQIGSYRVVKKLGEGGMGAVYEAVHVQIERRAAIKVLHPQFSANREIATRFLNEARAVNIIQHPSIVNIYELGQLPSGAAYIVMEYLEGHTLTARLKWSGGRLGAATLRFARQIASALAAAHQKGIIHRDLKPDNVMIVGDPETPAGERIKLLDFGIAKLAPAQNALAAATRSEGILGTPAYMSPEQCRGADEVDEKADVYSLGIILYQFLAGRPPFMAGGLGELLALQLYVAPQPLREVDPRIPESLAALVHAMLAKAAAARPTMQQVAAQLERINTHQDKHLLSVAGPRRKRAVLLVGGIGVVLALLGGLFAYQQLHPRGVVTTPAGERAAAAAGEEPPPAKAPR